MGRGKDLIWDHVDKLNNKVIKCKYCGDQFVGGASRIKAHLSGIEGKGIRICTRVPKDVQIAASSTFGDSNKTPFSSVIPSNPPQDFDNSNMQTDSSRGKSVLTQNDVSEHVQIAACEYTTKGKSMTGRKKDRFWQYVESSLDGKVNKCNFCGHKFVGGASRIKWHLSKTEKMGIDICSNVPEDVQKAAYDASNKRLKRNIDSCHHEDYFVNSNSPISSSKGNVELHPMPASTCFMGNKFQYYIDEIWGWLTNEEEPLIGVCGMGGVGKTTLLKHIYNKLLDVSYHVIWFSTVSEDNSIFQLQKIIAESFDMHISDKDDKMKITAKLFHTLNETRKCVIILDDMWEDIDLESVGIPLTNSEVQVVIASRLFDLCHTMGCKKHILNVNPLDKHDSFKLFFNVLGEDKSLFPEEAADIAESIIEKCEGLPLAIVSIARILRGKKDITEWKYILKNLRNFEKGQHDMKKYVFPPLKLSYIHLNDKTLQECLLQFALHAVTRIRKEELTMHFVDEELINRNDSLEAQFGEGRIVLNKLINSNLLFKVDELHADIHNLVLGMAVSIANESEGYMVKISESLRKESPEISKELSEIPPEQEWKEDLRKVSLTIEEIPSDTSPSCPKLSTLLLCHSSLKFIPDCFFMNMPSLKVLDLSDCYKIKHLPTSVSNLKSLTALLLGGCWSLEHVPSLEKLQKLRRLDLSGTKITELPLGLETLFYLRWLTLENTEELTMSRPLMIPKLINLQVLMLDMYDKSMMVEVADLKGLKMLESISASFNDRNEFNAYVRRIVNAQNCGLRNYFLGLLEGTVGSWTHRCDTDYVYCTSKAIMFTGIGNTASLLLPIDMNELRIVVCHEWRSLCDVLLYDYESNSKTCKIKKCDISHCVKLENVFCSSSFCSFCSSLQSIESLRLGYLESLSVLCKESKVATTAPWGPFSSLKDLHIYGCDCMKTLLIPAMTGQLQNLEKLRVDNCSAMEEIFSSENYKDCTDVDIDVAIMMFPAHYQPFQEICSSGARRNNQEEQGTDALHIHPIKLPKLKSVYLYNLPRLNRVYEGILACDSLQEFSSHKCPKLKQVPQILPPFQISVQ